MSIGQIVDKASNFLKNAAKGPIPKIQGPLASLDENPYKKLDALKFPSDVGGLEYPHYVKFNIYAQKSSGYLQATNNTDLPEANDLNPTKRTTTQIQSKPIGEQQIRQTVLLKQTIHLYIPETVQQTSAHSYDVVSITESLKSWGLLDVASKDVASLVKQVATLGGSNSSEGSGLTELAGEFATRGLGFGDVTDLILLLEKNKVRNPQFEVLYKSTANREFLFDFKFTPREQSESLEILNIIKAFKFYSAPELPQTEGSDGRYLIPPYEFTIDFYFGENNNTALHKIGNCVLEAVDVNYVTAGQFATFADGMPIEIAMQLRFKETFIVTKDLVEKGY